MKIFWTLIEADVEQKISEACIAFANRFALEQLSAARTARATHYAYLLCDLFLFVPGEGREGVKLRADQKGYCGLHFRFSHS